MWPRSAVAGLRAVLRCGPCVFWIGSLNAMPEPQWVAFEKTYSEVAASERQAVVRLKRFADAEMLRLPLTLALRVQYSSGAGAGGLATVSFGAGDSTGVCTVRLPEGGVVGVDVSAFLEIVDSGQVQGFARAGHFVRKQAGALPPGGPVINAVIFSGAETPENAVEGGTPQTTVAGGIVALGGASVPAALFPARLVAKTEYATGVWTPPLSPAALVFEFGAWKSNKAP